MSLKLLLFFLLFPVITSTYHQFSVMLDPAGNAHHTGRQLSHSFERGTTLQFCDKLKHVLEQYFPIQVILTHRPGELVRPLQNANFANRLPINLFLSIHFFQESNTVPRLYIYQFSYDNDFIQTPVNLCFYPYDKAYILNFKTTSRYASLIKDMLEKQFQKKFETLGVFKLPFKPLIGIICPSIGIEIGLKTSDDWVQWIEPVAECIKLIQMK